MVDLTPRRGIVRCYGAAAAAAGDKETVRVRFAPSPTGNLHVGGARTALYNYLFAQQLLAKGQSSSFVLRVEDTDRARSTKESEDAVLRDMKWLGLDWNEGPFRQSERGDLYKRKAEELLGKDLAYKCFCTNEEITEMKEKAAAEGKPPVYSGKWAKATNEEVEAELAKGTPYAVRFRVPQDELVTIQDSVRGEVTWNTNTLGDFIIMRSEGTPVYNFCVAVDDADMGITQVVRAEEHLPNTLRQVLIYNALGLEPPNFAHCSLILAPDRSKLSKRHGATSVGEFQEEGYLPEALMNYLALLGWNDGTEQEMFSKEELIDKFSLERITKSAAIFDKQKLNWMNSQYIRQMDTDVLVKMLVDLWSEKNILKSDATEAKELVGKVVEVSRESLITLNQSIDEFSTLMAYPLAETLENKKAQKCIKGGMFDVAQYILDSYFVSGDFKELLESKPEAFKDWMKAAGKEMGKKGKDLFLPMRICMTGCMQGPDVGDQVYLVKKAEGVVNASELGNFVSFEERMNMLKKAVEHHNANSTVDVNSNA
jgi:glutamyl-tRNA synthetase